jgi:hypothetical protein
MHGLNDGLSGSGAQCRDVRDYNARDTDLHFAHFVALYRLEVVTLSLRRFSIELLDFVFAGSRAEAVSNFARDDPPTIGVIFFHGIAKPVDLNAKVKSVFVTFGSSTTTVLSITEMQRPDMYHSGLPLLFGNAQSGVCKCCEAEARASLPNRRSRTYHFFSPHHSLRL